MILKADDFISWRGCWGSEKEQTTKLKSMEQTKREHEKDGVPVTEVVWNETTNKWTFPFIANLDNSHWAYSYQLAPINNKWNKPPEWYGNRN